ncbi:MAG: hypothetical protein HY319_30390 [Armatimonadetes bacterium]|nr:hypothetical protein [Armatimonadota bacterium]
MTRYPLDRNIVPEWMAERLERFHNDRNAIVIGIPRSGTRIAIDLARRLSLPSEVLFIDKLEQPTAVAYSEDGFMLHDHADPGWHEVQRQRKLVRELERRAAARMENRMADLHETRMRQSIKKKSVIMVDDAMVTGLTMLAAVHVACRENAREIIVAAPVAHREALDKVAWFSDEIVCLCRVSQFDSRWDGISPIPDLNSLELTRMWNQLCWRRQGRRNLKKKPFGEYDTRTLERLVSHRLAEAA